MVLTCTTVSYDMTHVLLYTCTNYIPMRSRARRHLSREHNIIIILHILSLLGKCSVAALPLNVYDSACKFFLRLNNSKFFKARTQNTPLRRSARCSVTNRHRNVIMNIVLSNIPRTRGDGGRLAIIYGRCAVSCI